MSFKGALLAKTNKECDGLEAHPTKKYGRFAIVLTRELARSNLRLPVAKC